MCCANCASAQSEYERTLRASNTNQKAKRLSPCQALYVHDVRKNVGMATINRGKEKEKKKRNKEEAEKGKYNRLTTLTEVVVCSPMSRAIWRRAHASLDAINAFLHFLKHSIRSIVAAG